MPLIKERILQFAENKGVKKTKFPEKIGMTYSSFKGDALKTPINSEAIGNLLSLYPDVDLEWLITGKEAKQKVKEEIAVNKPQENYGNNYREKYIEILEENIELQKKVINLLEINETLKKYSSDVSK
jgi:hypothetical protein